MNENDYDKLQYGILLFTFFVVAQFLLTVWYFGIAVGWEFLVFILSVLIIGFFLALFIQYRKLGVHRTDAKIPESNCSCQEKTVEKKGGVRMASAWSVIQYRAYEDFLYGSFDVYVTEDEVVIRGRLRRGNPSLYMLVRKAKR